MRTNKRHIIPAAQLKQFLIGILCLTGFIKVVAQDTIYHINGRVIFANVIEISDSEIKYKRTDNLEGPYYIAFRKDVEYIKYRNGEKEYFTKKIKEDTVKEQIVNNAIIDALNPTSDLIITSNRDTINCTIDKKTEYYLYYHIARKGMDYSGVVPMTSVVFFGDKKNYYSTILIKKEKTFEPINEDDSAKKVENKTPNKTFEVVNPEKPWLRSDTTISEKEIEGKKLDKPWLIQDAKEQKISSDTINLDKPWLIPEPKKGEKQNETKFVEKPWLIQDPKSNE